MNNAFVISLAYPETVVRMSTEWFGPLLQFIGIGKNNYVRAGHAALVLVCKQTGNLEYFDFGRYITPHSFGRVRSAQTDFELNLSFKAKIVDDSIVNLDEILNFFATNPQLTHGEGTMLASVCDNVNFENAKAVIDKFSNPVFVNYSVFKSNGTNCARFVTSVLINGCNNLDMKRKLKKSQWFTPSPASNVVLGSSNSKVYKVTSDGKITYFNDSVRKVNFDCFLDRLPDFKPKLLGNLKPNQVDVISENAQWISGIGSGAWFEIHHLDTDDLYRLKRIAPNGNLDVDGVFKIDNKGFEIDMPYSFKAESNCSIMYLVQDNTLYTFQYVMHYANFNLKQMERIA